MKNLLENLNETQTENGAPAYHSTNDPRVDFYYFSIRGQVAKTVQAFRNSYIQFPKDTLALLLHLRDCRGGKGERDLAFSCLRELKTLNIEHYRLVLKNLMEFGRYLDYVDLEEPEYIASQLIKDAEALSEKRVTDITLAGKWAPSDTSKKKSRREQSALIRKAMGISTKQYRKLLKALRTQLNIVEKLMSENRFSEIDYGKIPSVAMQKYKTAFFTKDEERIKAFLERVKKGQETLNTSQLDAFTLVKEARVNLYNTYNKLSKDQIDFLDEQWKSIVSDVSANLDSNILVASDCSGSMLRTVHGSSAFAMDVSIALGLLSAQISDSEAFGGLLALFSENTKFADVSGKNLSDVMMNVISKCRFANTDVLSLFKAVLDRAIDNNLEQEKLPDLVVIVSDMQFDNWGVHRNKDFAQKVDEMFREHNYIAPRLVFWNVASYDNVPVVADQQGVMTVSGFSQSAINMFSSENILEAFTPLSAVLDIANNPRYNIINE